MRYYHNFSGVKDIWLRNRVKSEIEVKELKLRMLVARNPLCFYHTFVRDKKPVLHDNEIVNLRLLEKPNTRTPSQTGIRGYWVRAVIIYINKQGKWEEDNQVLLLKLTKTQYEDIKEAGLNSRVEARVVDYKYKQMNLKTVKLSLMR